MTIEEFLNSQESLGDEFQKVLDNNRDDLYETTPEITWTNCADKMPPDDFNEIIVSACGYYTIHDGKDLKYWISTDHAKWTEFTKGKWEGLNK